MIDPLSLHMPATGATDRSALVDQLTRRGDVNRDGDVTSAEFASFLSALMESLDEEQAAERGAAAPTPTPTAAPSTPEAAPMTPAQASRALRQAFEPITRNR